MLKTGRSVVHTDDEDDNSIFAIKKPSNKNKRKKPAAFKSKRPPPSKKRRKFQEYDPQIHSLFHLDSENGIYQGLLPIMQTCLLVTHPFEQGKFSWPRIYSNAKASQFKRATKKTRGMDTGVLKGKSDDTDSPTSSHENANKSDSLGKKNGALPVVETSVHRESFLQMEKNMYDLAVFVLRPEERIKQHELQIAQFELLEKTPLNGDHNNIRIRQHATLMKETEKEKLRVIVQGIERGLYEERMQQFWETWNQLPIENRQNEDQLLNFYCQFFQTSQTIPEVTTQKICPECKHKLFNSKRESDWDCTNALCALFQTYLTPKTTVRIAYNNHSATGVTSESKAWTNFITLIAQFVEGDNPFTQELKDMIIERICATKHNGPMTNFNLKSSAINQALKHLDKKELCDRTPRIMYEFQEDDQKCALMQEEEHEIISARLKFAKLIFDNYQLKHKLELCDPKYAFRQICALFGWTHLFALFPVEESEEEKSKWEALISFVSKHDRSHVWRVPTLNNVLDSI